MKSKKIIIRSRASKLALIYAEKARAKILKFYPEVEIKKITNKMWKNIGRNFGELIHLKNYKPLNCSQTKIIDLKKIDYIFSKTFGK